MASWSVVPVELSKIEWTSTLEDLLRFDEGGNEATAFANHLSIRMSFV